MHDRSLVAASLTEMSVRERHRPKSTGCIFTDPRSISEQHGWRLQGSKICDGISQPQGHSRMFCDIFRCNRWRRIWVATSVSVDTTAEGYGVEELCTWDSVHGHVLWCVIIES
jgi:hypothetical protein